MKMKQIISMIILFLVTIDCIAKSPIVIIDDNVQLYDSESTKSKIIAISKLFDVVILKKQKETNGMINVIRKDKENGWIGKEYTSYITNDWLLINKLLDLQFYLPKNFKYKYYKGKEENNNLYIYVEDKIVTDDFYITLEIIKSNIDKFIKDYNFDVNNKQKKRLKKINYDKNIIYYDIEPDGIHSTIEQEILFRAANGYLYKFLVSHREKNPSKEKQLEAKKILFSILKNTDLKSL